MEPIIFGMAVINLISYFIKLTIDPNISFYETLIVSVSGGRTTLCSGIQRLC